MFNAIISKIFGYRLFFFKGDTLVIDRWIFLKHNIKDSDRDQHILDIGCGTGAFTIGLAKLKFRVTGLTWDKFDTEKAIKRANDLKLNNCDFIIQDARSLDQRIEFQNKFDSVICFENIEHILNDQKLICDISTCLKENGTLYLTTPNINFIPITKDDDGPFEVVENGWHVRRGYSKERLTELCSNAGLKIEKIEFVSGYLSQKITRLFRKLNRINKYFSFILTLPLRLFPLLLDRFIKYEHYSIAIIAKKI
jgi:2-polyprenyl-3-methyl-5-hydroxy-6-metoxy-1,4-benzoquinol methylase